MDFLDDFVVGPQSDEFISDEDEAWQAWETEIADNYLLDQLCDHKIF